MSCLLSAASPEVLIGLQLLNQMDHQPAKTQVMKGVSFHTAVIVLLLMPVASAFSQDFMFIVIPDPQNLNSTVYSSQTQWIANNKTALNIVFSTCVGDLVNTATSSTEYEKADAAFDLLDVGGVPYSVSPGNHDMSTGTLWANYFGILRFDEKDWYGGSSGNYNTYSLFSASGNDFIVINLQYNPGTSQLDWADARLKEYPDRRGIVVQHDILNVNNSWINQASYTALKDNPNLFLMLCGHTHTASDGAAYRAELGDDGHTIHIVQADYQEFITPANTGYLRILRFSPENDMIYMTTYSPYTGGSITSTTNYDKADLAYNLNNLHYRSAGSGNWTNIASWEASLDLISWVPALTYPNSTANTITVTDGQTLTVNDNVKVNQFTIEAGGAVTVPAGRTLTNGGAANDFVIKSTGSLSGSLITTGTGNVSGSVTYSRQMPGSGSSVNWHYVSSPLSLSSSPSGSFYAWNEVEGDWDASITTIPASGRGYTLETNGNSISFVGSLVTSDFTVNATSPYLGTIDGTEATYDGRSWSNTGAGHSGTTIRSSDNYGGGGWNLLGNPYPSAMSVSAFIDANYSSTPSVSQFDPNYVALYLYNGSTYNYVAKSTGWPQGTYLSETHIQVGQGFFVLAMNDLSTFTFSRSMQGPDTDVSLLKSAMAEEQWPGLQVKVKYGDKENSTLVVYNENMTAGLDPGYDVGLMSAGSDVEIYTSLVKDNGVNFARQALPIAGDGANIVAVGIDSEKGGKVEFSAFVVPLENHKFYLEDKATGIFTDLGARNYTVILPAQTYGYGRFFIHSLRTRDIKQNTEYPSLADVRIWVSNDRVIVKGIVSDKAMCEIYDLRGQKVLETRLSDGDLNTVTLPSGLQGVYLVRVTDGVKLTTRKVVIL